MVCLSLLYGSVLRQIKFENLTSSILDSFFFHLGSKYEAVELTFGVGVAVLLHIPSSFFSIPKAFYLVILFNLFLGKIEKGKFIDCNFVAQFLAHLCCL